jgi:hypothetical protein
MNSVMSKATEHRPYSLAHRAHLTTGGQSESILGYGCKQTGSSLKTKWLEHRRDGGP